MKKLIMVLLVAMMATGCNVETNEKVKHNKTTTAFTKVRKFDFHDHTYIYFYTYGCSGVVHDPDCQCFKK